MRIFILNPFLYTGKLEKMARKRQPLDLAYIASILRKEHTIKLLDANALNFTENQTLNSIEEFHPDILILTSTPIDRWEVPSHEHIQQLTENLVDITNKVKVPYTVMLGAHGTLTPKWILENIKVSFVVRGEPEETTYNLVKEIAEEKNFYKVKGISYFEDGVCIHTANAPRIENLDALPFPAYDLLPMERYRYTYPDLDTPFSLMMTSRGCPFSCIYCLKAMMPNEYIVRSPASVLAEMKYLKTKFGVKSIYFQDWEFMIDQKRIAVICDWLISNPLGISWGCNGRASDINEEMVIKMKKAGCVRINIGFESGSQKILDMAKKNMRLEQVERAFSICRKYEIHFGIYSIINLPGENARSIRETEEFLAKNNLKTLCAPNLPIPYFGTELFNMLKKQTGKENFSWGELDKYAGRVGTKYSPFLAKLLRWHYKYRSKYGQFYFTRVDFQKQMFGRLIKQIL